MQADTSALLDGMAMEQQLHGPIKTYFLVSAELTDQEYLLIKDYYILSLVLTRKLIAKYNDGYAKRIS